MKLGLYIGNDMRVALEGLRDSEGDYQNGGTVRVWLKSVEDETDVPGQAWPLTLPYVAGSDGDYEAVLDDAVELAEGVPVLLEMEAVAGGLRAFWRQTRYPEYRVI